MGEAERKHEEAEARLDKQWTVHIQRSDGVLLGLGLGSSDTDIDCFKVNSIKNDGAVKIFNAANPDDALRIGDHVVKANGAIGKAAMKDEFKANPIDLVIKRQPTAEEKITLPREAG